MFKYTRIKHQSMAKNKTMHTKSPSTQPISSCCPQSPLCSRSMTSRYISTPPYFATLAHQAHAVTGNNGKLKVATNDNNAINTWICWLFLFSAFQNFYCRWYPPVDSASWQSASWHICELSNQCVCRMLLSTSDMRGFDGPLRIWECWFYWLS